MYVYLFISRQYFSSGGSEGPNGKNLALLLHSYVQRTDLNLAREIAPNGKELLGATRALKTPVLNMTGDHSPHVEATVAFNGRLQPNRCTWMKIQVCIHTALCLIFMILVSLENVKKYSHVVSRLPQRLKSTLFEIFSTLWVPFARAPSVRINFKQH